MHATGVLVLQEQIFSKNVQCTLNIGFSRRTLNSEDILL